MLQIIKLQYKKQTHTARNNIQQSEFCSYYYFFYLFGCSIYLGFKTLKKRKLYILIINIKLRLTI